MFCSANQNQMVSQKDTIKKIGSYLFRFSDLLGSGNFSSVYSGVDQNTGRPVAVKVVKMSSLKSKTALKLLQNEILILKDLDNANVIKCYDELTSINNCYIITELCMEDLEQQLKKRGRFEEKQISKWIYDILKGLQYLENNSIIHRDLKISNIFITQNGSAKIADFGFAIKSKQNFKDLSIGSPIYMSPEGLIDNIYGPKTDIWALGVLIYELLHGDTPLDSCKTEIQLKRKVFEPPIFKVKISNDLRKFIQCCMRIKQSQRFTIHQLLETPYAKRIKYQIDGAKIYKPYSSGYCSTYNSTTELSSTGAINPNPNRFQIMEEISYSSAVSLVHYCRLIHKTTQRLKSPILSQWLLNVSFELLKSKISRNHTDKEQYEKLKEVIVEYHNKYQKEHQELKSQVVFSDVLKECKIMLNNMHFEVKKFVNLLISETKILKRIVENHYKMDNFGKQSESKKFLVSLGKLNEGQNINTMSLNPLNNLNK